MKIIFSEECMKYAEPGHPESPERVSSTSKFLLEKGFDFTSPVPCTDDVILLAHSSGLLDEVKGAKFIDLDTPALPDIYDHARLSAGAAIEAAKCCLMGENTFSLMRPPGHHATRNNLGGFCYFNSIAIASLKMKQNVDRVAIVDFDCHHGNGTEDIFLGREDFLYLSLHQSPLFPGTGLTSRENCLNYPLDAGITPDEYLSVFAEGLKKVEDFNPDLLAVSAGFDSYRLDPITNLNLELESYREIGAMISGIKKPTFSVLEGGYSGDLAECVYKFLTGLEDRG